MNVRGGRVGALKSALLLTVLLSGCILPRTRPVPANELATRLVIALDGIDYRDVMAARAQGMFKQFRQPSRLISTFPSISDVAWHEIFGVLPPRGYQRIYYSNAYNTMVGGTLDAIKPIEFEDRMDMAFGSKFHHLSAYLASDKVARGEVKDAVRKFFTIAGRPTVYVYNVGPDALQHTRGDLAGYLRQLDARLDTLQHEYTRRTGRSLEIVVLSDHGHNHANDAKLLPVTKTLEAAGFHVAQQLRSPMDVVFSVDGVTTGFGVFAQPDSLATLTRVLATTEGVQMVSTRMNDSVFFVQDSLRQARIDLRHGAAGDRFRYVPLSGDPLRYASTIDRMRAEESMDGDGFANAETWLRYTAATEYPAAVVRIARGHTQVTLNTAPILVSLDDQYRVGLGMVSLANRLRPLGGTHGSLASTDAQGIVMTNFQDTHDDLTKSVRTQFKGFPDFGDIKTKDAGARLTNAWLLEQDERNPFHRMLAAPSTATRASALEVWFTQKEVDLAAPGDTLRVELRRTQGTPMADSLLAVSDLPLLAAGDGVRGSLKDGLMMTGNRRHYLVSLEKLFIVPPAPNATYEMRVSLRRPPAGHEKQTEATRLVTLVVRSNDRGEIWPY